MDPRSAKHKQNKYKENNTRHTTDCWILKIRKKESGEE